MAYSYENKDIVINGWENGIADSPYSGISDIRNIDLISIPTEASVALATLPMVTQSSLQSQSFTASAAGDGGILLTWAGGTALANNTAVTFATTGTLPTNLAVNKAYYVYNTTATTFQVSLNASSTPIAYVAAGSNSTFSTIDMASPKIITPYGYTDGGTTLYTYLYFCADSMGRVWYYYAATTQWIYLNNPYQNEARAGVVGTGNGQAIYRDFLFMFEYQNINYIRVVSSSLTNTLAYLTTYTNWVQAWKGMTGPWIATNFPITISHSTVIDTSDTIYFCNTSFIGSIARVSGQVFDPATPATYTYNASALSLPSYEVAQCISVLGTNILVGGQLNIAYNWDRVSIGYSPIYFSENSIVRIVSVNTNAFVFIGQRGRIYITNGVSAQLFKKVPDHLSGQPNPYYTWGGATFNRNQLYFGIQATTNAGVAINQYGGLWALDLDSKALRLVNQLSFASYSGNVTALSSLGGLPTSDGYGLYIGWYTTIGGIDKGSSSPYTGTQAYIDTDMIPIGQFLNKTTFNNVEWKLAVPLVSGESITLSYRTNISSAYTQFGTTNTVGALSDFYLLNFDQVQWIQLRAQITSTATTPSFVRLKEIRIRT